MSHLDTRMLYRNQRIAVILPCHNEELTVRPVVDGFRQALPEAEIYIFNNLSTDRTAEIALEVGAHLRNVNLKGKGNVVRRMFADVEADIYVMVDGDATYCADDLPAHIQLMLKNRLDMVLGVRTNEDDDSGQYRRGHRAGNRILTSTAMLLFGGAFSDMLSGYRIFSRRYVKSFPARARGFETETELTIHALQLRMPCAEVPVLYRARPDGSHSKLSTYKDGLLILRTIIRLVTTERPLLIFGGLAVILSIISLVIGVPVVAEFMRTGLVLRLPTALLATGLMLASLLSGLCGVLLDHVTIARADAKHLRYLSIPGP